MKTLYFVLFFLPFGFWGGGEKLVKFVAPYDTETTVSVNVNDSINPIKTAYFSGTFATLPPCLFTLSHTKIQACENKNNGRITIVPLSQGNPAITYSYSWESGQTTPFIGGLSEGTYTVTVTDNIFNCTITESITLEEVDSISISPNSTYINPASYNEAVDGSYQTSFVGGTSPYLITVTDTNNSSSTSTLSSNASTFEFNTLASGTYDLVIEGTNSCSFQTTFVIPAPKLIAFSPTPICRGEELTLQVEHLINGKIYRVAFNGIQQPIDYIYQDGMPLKVAVPADANSGPLTMSILENATFHPILPPSNGLTILDEAEVIVLGLESRYCSNSAPIQFYGSPQVSNSSPEGFSGMIGSDTLGTDVLTIGGLFTPSAIDFSSGVPGDPVEIALTYTYLPKLGTTQCTPKTVTYQIIVDEAPDVSELDNNTTEITINTPPKNIFTLFGTSSIDQSGIFSGPGVTNYNFDPSQFSVDSIVDITYTLPSPLNSCVSVATAHIKIKDQSFIAGLDSTYCDNETANIDPDPTCLNYTFSLTSGAPSVLGITTDTSSAGNGFTITPSIVSSPQTVTVYAWYCDPLVSVSDCNETNAEKEFVQSVTINPLPKNLTIDLANEYCEDPFDSLPFTATPSGGTFYIVNTSGSSTNPSLDLSTINDHTITYSLTEYGCTATTSKTVTVNELPTVTIDNSLDTGYCHMAAEVELFGNYSPSGTFTITTPNNSIIPNADFFNPLLEGKYTVEYEYTETFPSNHMCSNTVSREVQVSKLPEVSIDNLQDKYCLKDTATLELTPSIGGTLTIKAPDGTITTNSFFNATQTGDYEIKYIINNGCENSTESTVPVVSLPNYAIDDELKDSYCTNNETVTWTGSDQSSDDHFYLLFDDNGTQDTIQEGNSLMEGEYPVPGKYEMEYTYTSIESGCSNSTTQCMTIYDSPRAGFTLDISCAETTINFIDTSFIPVDDALANINWTYNGTITADSLFTDSLNAAVAYVLQLEIETELGCRDSKSEEFRIGANPEFNYNLNVAIENKPIPFYIDSNDIIKNFGLTEEWDTVVYIRYDFGEGIPIDTLVDQLQHAYESPGVYETSIEIQTSRDCSNTVYNLAYVVPYITEFPYCSDFETAPWYAHSNRPDSLWRLNTTSFSGNRGKIWATHFNENTLGYQAGADGWVYGPSFNLSNMDRPYLSIDVYYDNVFLNDGMIVEISNNGSVWERLGEPDEGLNWYEDEIIFPILGDFLNYPPQSQAFGWTGKSGGQNPVWQTARYKLDQHRDKTNLRVRVAFATISDSPSNSNIAAFHNVCVKERGQNVLFEHFTNLNVDTAQGVDTKLYNDCLEYDYDNFIANPLDIIFTQYHTAEPQEPEVDQIYQSNSGDMYARAERYGINQPLLLEVNGGKINSGYSADWKQNQIDLLLLADPIFDIQIPMPVINTNGSLTVSATVKALKAHTFSEDLDLYFLIIEDKVNAADRTLRNVVRKILPTTGITVPTTWAENQSDTYTQTWADLSTINNQSNLFAVAFLQNRVSNEIYQSVSSQIVEPPTPTAITQTPSNDQSITLYPNPTSQQVKVAFNAPHNQTFEWELFDAVGNRVATGKEKQGNQLFDINTRDFTNGIYFLVLYAEDAAVVLQEKLIIIH